MKYVFGPLPSRRLGQSLGIDTVPLKTCNWNCAYCQLGRTQAVVNERKEYVPSEDVLAEVRLALDSHPPGSIDWVTFVGSGEPTLHSNIGRLIRQVKSLTDLPVGVITNGSLLYSAEVREDLMPADAVMPTLDAGSPEMYCKINRPHQVLGFERLVYGMISFRQEYRGSLWLEIMLLKGLNDTENALHDLAVLLSCIKPDKVHISLPIRPPAEDWVQPADEEGVMRAVAILGTRAHVLHPAMGTFDLSGAETVIDGILGIVTRHPMRQEELEITLARWNPNEIGRVLRELEASEQVRVVERYGVRFWCSADSRYSTGRKIHSGVGILPR